MSTFSGINIALSALFAYQRGLDVTGQNVANVNTPGYHRQSVVLGARAGEVPGPMGTGLLCGGVDVLGLQRAETGYLDLQIRLAASTQGRWTASQEPLGAVQSVLSQPLEDDLGALLDKFWGSWQALSASPDQLAPRIELRQAAHRLTTSLNTRYSHLVTLQASLYASIENKVTELNQLAAKVAELNGRIAASTAAGRESGELLDQRQQALEGLARIGGVVAYAPEADSGAIVSLGGQPLVQGDMDFALEVGRGPLGEVQLTWAADGLPAQVTGGELAGLIAVRDEQVPQYRQALDDIAAALVASVNDLHDDGAGMRGQVGAFLSGTGAADIRLADAIAADPAAIAAGAAGLPGDGGVAAAIAALRDQALLGGQTLGQAASRLVTEIGSQVNEAESQAAVAEALRRQLTIQQQSIGGVSLDEEMANMIEYQHAYNASARVLATMDEMIADLLEQVG